MNKPIKECMLLTAKKYHNLSNELKNEFNIRMLNRIYTSFFIFEPKYWKTINIKEVITSIVENEFDNFDTSIIINLSDFVKDTFLENVEIWKTYMTPFLKIKYSPIKHKWNNDVKNIFDDFIATFYQYICVSEVKWKIIVFTDIWEDFLIDSFKKLDLSWYKKVELHNIIPKIIDLIAENIHNSESKDSIKELWIHFPLSMLWYHSEIIWKMKEWKNVTNDNNFKKLISYGLLDAVKINTDFNVSFNNDNDSDKYRLYWFLYSKNVLNDKIFIELWKFIEKIDWIKSETKNNNFAWLPIYVISSKKVYENKESYPYFTYNKVFNEFTENDELKLDLNFDWEWNNTIKWNYIITWIYPQYFKERIYKDIKWAYCYLKRNEDKNEWKLSDDIILDIFWNEKKIRCDDFLNEIRKWFALNYMYEPEISGWIPEWYYHPDVSSWDLYLTAFNEDNKQNDYLINITTPKKANQIKLWHQITINIFKLSSFNFNIDNIKKIIDNYNTRDGNWKFKIKAPYLWTISKVFDTNWHEYQINWEKIFNISSPCTPSKWNNEWKTKKWVFKITDLWKINKEDYVNNELKLEDIWSLAFIELLKLKWHKAYFWWRSNLWTTRELADVISIDEFESKWRKIININLFHMKKDPFEQLSESNYSIAFSTYTVVVWQALEKIKSFLYQKNYDEIISSLKTFFEKDKWNYEIFEVLNDIINKNRDNIINFNIFFPIKEKDYFNIRNIETNSNNKLSLETNWKRLKVISDIFKSNVDNVVNNDYKMKMNLNLWLVICKKTERYNQKNKKKWDIETSIKIINNIEKYLFNISW